ncbi:MAG: hypothetical protein ACJAUD_002386 [Crocinitomicaceae bacterium]|jgi:hypothetical protein
MKNSLLLSFVFTFVFAWSSFGQTFDGYALYNLQNQNTTYLIDKDQNIAHSWSNSVSCNYTVLLKPNGNIVRGGVYSGNQLTGAAIGGMVQEIDPSGTVVWEYIYSNANHCSHHDITLLDNGNVILTAWEVKTAAECTQAGVQSPNNSGQWPTHFIELQQNGSSADIVWEWHIWDHFIQDYDASKDNFGVVSDHPELMDINLLTVSSGGGGPGGGGADWFHVNGIDYNEDLDQLVFSSRFLSEIIIIDHSTTTLEAASHSGGDSGAGGDFIYRWGKPSNYASAGAQTISEAVHDPRWIKDDGRPNGGYIQFFNNEGGTGGSSVIDAIEAPESGFMYTMTGNSYGPSNYAWRHECLANSSGQSAHNRMSNGNTFVNVSNEYMYEVDANDNLIWQYNAGPTKAFRYECGDAGIIALLGTDPCDLLSLSEETLDAIQFYPNPSETGVFTIDGVNVLDQDVLVTVVDIYGKVVFEMNNAQEIDLSAMTSGVYFATLNFGGKSTVTKKLSLVR